MHLDRGLGNSEGGEGLVGTSAAAAHERVGWEGVKPKVGIA